jgi:hypothetical protein
MRQLPVLTEALTVVAGDHEERALIVPAGPHGVHQPAQLRVREGDLACVGMGGGAGEVVGGGIVAGMGVVQVHPHEEALRCGLEPPDDGVDDPIGGSLREAEFARRSTRGHAIVVVVEPPGEPILPVEHDRPDEGGRGESPLAHLLRQSGDVAIELEGRVVSHPVPRRIERSHQRGVGRQGERRRRDRGLEADAPLGQLVERGGVGPGPPVTAEVIRAQRVDGDQDHALYACARGAARRERLQQGEGERETPRLAHRSRPSFAARETLRP